MANTRIVLVRPEHAVNIGAVARIAANTGMAGLDLVAPSEWRTVECWRTAWGATDVLDRASVHETVRAALADSGYVVAVSRRTADGVTHDIRDVAQDIAGLAPGITVSLVFGPETHGLAMDELALCGRVAHIPSHPAQPSLNLSHAVMVAAYEVFRASGAEVADVRRSLATHAQKEQALAVLLEGLRAMHALDDAERRIYARLWRNLVERTDLSPREARLIAHMGRKLSRVGRPRSARRGGAAPSHRAGADAAGATEQGATAYIDVRVGAQGFSIPLIKWRELLFTGAMRRDGDAFVRDPGRPLPPFERPDLFPDGARFTAVAQDGRVELTRRQ